MTALFESLTLKLTNVVELATQDQGSLTPQARQALVRSTKEFKDALKEAHDYATTLPGGDHSVEEQDEVIEMLEKLKERKRQQLAEFADRGEARQQERGRMYWNSGHLVGIRYASTHDRACTRKAHKKAHPTLPFIPGWPRFPVISRRPCGSLPYMLRDASLVLFLSGLLHFALFATSAVAANVTWISPSRGDAYGSGNTIVGQWDAEKPVVSPSIRLCVLNGGGTNKRAAASGGSCGTAVWPTVHQMQSDGSFVIHIAIVETLPNVTTASQCYLEMKDDFGETSASPAFSYQHVHAMEAQPSAEDASTPTPAPSSPPSSPDSVPQPSASSQQAPSLEESRMPTPTAAYAVPLSFVGSALLCAGGLAYQQRRRLRAERRKEQDALQARQTLSRQPTLDLVGLGFTNLGRGPAPGRSPAASASASLQRQDSVRSTSVSRMRAWRRGVSQHHLHPHSHSHSHHHADDETYVARSDDGRSVASGRSGPAGAYLHRPAQPRRPTREPFYASRSQARRTTVPAGLYRESPIGLPQPRDGGRESRYATYGRRRYIAEEEEDWGRLKRRDDRRRPAHASEDVDRIKVESYHNANINDDVFSHYLDLSPIPLSPTRSPPRDPSSVSRPERLHVRRYAQDATHDSAQHRVEERDLYTVVARKISRDDFV
ncbi:hypothetical protein BD309DRAFT_1006711 [Dichomitus squalens]|nr:hypothetical protein BD309DRAFT_1006711 [Dichomitus squalens]